MGKNSANFFQLKCKVNLFGKDNSEKVYNMRLDEVEIHLLEKKNDLEKNLGILASKDLKWENQDEKID